MSLGIGLEILWFDDDMFELRVRADNGRFAGTTDLYERLDVARRLADAIRGVPVSTTDDREFTLGSFTQDPHAFHGAVRLRPRFREPSRDAVVDVRVQTHPWEPEARSETAEFVVPVEAAAVDDCVRELNGMPMVVGASAWLRSAL